MSGIFLQRSKESFRLRRYSSIADAGLAPTTPLAVWQAAVSAAGGTLTGSSVTFANNLLNQMSTRSYYAKLVYLLPFLGNDIIAARVPLIDRKSVGIATNTGFVAGDFSETTGLTGGSGKRLDTLLKAGNLGSSSNGGLGAWINSYSAAGGTTEVGGSYNNDASSRYVVDIRATSLRFFAWGDANNRPQDTVSGTTGDYYGQRASATDRRLFVNGSQVGTTNTTSDGASGSSDKNILVLATNSGSFAYNNSRLACFYLTDGSLSSGEVSDLHSDLNTYLITPTGR